jgi:hypothetical protein
MKTGKTSLVVIFLVALITYTIPTIAQAVKTSTGEIAIPTDRKSVV